MVSVSPAKNENVRSPLSRYESALHFKCWNVSTEENTFPFGVKAKRKNTVKITIKGAHQEKSGNHSEEMSNFYFCIINFRFEGLFIPVFCCVGKRSYNILRAEVLFEVLYKPNNTQANIININIQRGKNPVHTRKDEPKEENRLFHLFLFAAKFDRFLRAFPIYTIFLR